MTTEGVDYSFSHPSPAGLKAAGKTFAMRYVGPFCDNSAKGLTTGEAQSLQAAGLSIVYLVEGTAAGALAGWSQGVADARSAVAYIGRYGWPTDRPLYAAVDFDCTSAQWRAVADYLRGFASVVGLKRTGVYGGLRTMQWSARDHVAAWFFQTYAWSYGAWYGGNHVRQYRNGVPLAGGDVDLCTAMVDDFGQWPHQGGGDDVSQEDVVVGTSVLWDKAANRSDPTGRNFANDVYSVVSAAVSDEFKAVNATLAEIKAALAGIGSGGGGGAPTQHTHSGGTTGPATPVQ